MLQLWLSDKLRMVLPQASMCVPFTAKILLFFQLHPASILLYLQSPELITRHCPHQPIEAHTPWSMQGDLEMKGEVEEEDREEEKVEGGRRYILMHVHVEEARFVYVCIHMCS